MRAPHFATEEVADRFWCRRVTVADLQHELLEDARAGLLTAPRRLPPKYFYDSRGSALFDRICSLPEYYLTRAEDQLLARHARDIIRAVRPGLIVELGSGTSRKSRRLLDACGAERCYSRYAPLDVCLDVLLDSGQQLVTEYEWLNVTALAGDYSAALAQMPGSDGPRLFVFLGSTIGNFSAPQACEFLSEIGELMGPDDRLLLGADRVKEPSALHAAYNDAQGVTAEFNLNVLRVMNRDLGAKFDLDRFCHHACYDPVAMQVEMYLVARQAQRVPIAALNTAIEFAEGEAIQTEISRKFTLRSIGLLFARAGFDIEAHYEANQAAFSLLLARLRAAPSG